MRVPTHSARCSVYGFRSNQVKGSGLPSDRAFITSHKKIRFSREASDNFIRMQWDESRYHPVPTTTYLLDYPPVYVAHYRSQSTAYVGETTNICSRTIQHLDADPATREHWKGPAESPSDTMYVIGNSLLKKSPRFDIVNQLMLPPPGSPAIKELNYRRTNLQKDSRPTSPGIPYPKRTTNWMRTLSASTAAVSRERDQGRPRITKPRPAR